MTDKEIIDNNKLIAKFDSGLTFNEDGSCTDASQQYSWRPGAFEPLRVEHLGYHKAWGWLMPVVEKIEKLTIYDDNPLTFSVEILRQGCRVHRSWTTSAQKEFGWHQTGDKLASTYQAVVEFIKWHNSQA